MGDVRLLFPRDYLAAADLRGKEKVLTISAIIEREELKTSAGSERKPALRFKETDDAKASGKQVPTKLVLNKTNMKAIAKAVGSYESRDWIGKRITLYPTECMAFGEQVECIRIRPKAPSAKKGGDAEPVEEREPSPEELREPGADEDIDPETGEVKTTEAAE